MAQNQQVVLPVPGQKNILITSALPYVNNVPHLGNIIGSVLSADVFARYCRLRGHNTLYICGTDEYGTATETKALQEGLTPREICDKYNKIHSDIYKWFDIGFDYFGRTSTDAQTAIAQDIFLKLNQNNYLVADTVEQLYCETCSRFLADRYVEGTCPHCNFADARGDQCDGCQKLLNPTELKQPRCKVCSNSPIVKTSKHLFLDLPKLYPELVTFTEDSWSKGEWTANAQHITKGWVKPDSLKPRCLTRDLKWGTPVPIEEYKDKVFYVWFDAPIGYISITANYTAQWEQWWKNAGQVQLYQFMGKDNVPFHTVIFPASLLGTKDPWTTLNHISTTEYLNYENQKFSKSRGIGVFGDTAKNTDIPSEIWRYYLLANRPESSDSNFSWDDFMDKNNSELRDNVGNFINRALKFVASNFDSKIPAQGELTEDDKKFVDAVSEHIKTFITDLDKMKIRDGLKTILAISALGNKYTQDNQPWKLIKSDPTRCGTVIFLTANLVKTLVPLIEPYMPTLADKILQQLNSPHDHIKDTFEFLLPEGHVLGEPVPLIGTLEQAKINELKSKFGGNIVKFPAEIRAGKIKSVSDHAEADHLYVLKIDLGAQLGEKQVVSGLKNHYSDKALLQDKTVLVLTNLKDSKFKGVLSQGMVLVADNDNGKHLQVLTVDAPPGSVVLPQGASLDAKPKYTTKDFYRLDLRVSGGEALYENNKKLCVGANVVHPDGDIKEALIK